MLLVIDNNELSIAVNRIPLSTSCETTQRFGEGLTFAHRLQHLVLSKLLYGLSHSRRLLNFRAKCIQPF
jgi:hypothetical protein